MEVKVRMWSLNLGKPATIPQLNETMAIELGAKLLGEIILFTIPAAVLVFEYLRSNIRFENICPTSTKYLQTKSKRCKERRRNCH